MTLRHLKIFCAVCDNDFNTTKAAAHLNMSQPAVSLAIKELENYYGVSLFDRINKRLSITPAGEKLLNYANSISGLFEDMETTLKDWDCSGKLRVGADITIGTYFMADYIREFSQMYPDVDVEVFVENKSRIIEKLTDNQLDFALTESPDTNPLIVSDEYMSDSLVVVCPAGQYQQDTTVSAEEFLKHPLLLLSQGSSTREVFDAVCSENNLNPKVSWQSTSETALISAVKKGLGLAVLPYHMVKAPLHNGEISSVNIAGLDFGRKYYICHHRGKALSESTKAFISICQNHQTDIITG